MVVGSDIECCVVGSEDDRSSSSGAKRLSLLEVSGGAGAGAVMSLSIFSSSPDSGNGGVRVVEGAKGKEGSGYARVASSSLVDVDSVPCFFSSAVALV